jgi:hypothetical protein
MSMAARIKIRCCCCRHRGGAGNALAKLLDLLDLAGQLGGEGLLQGLQWTPLAMDPGQQHLVGRAHTVVLEE